jgi:hypothetical protein
MENGLSASDVALMNKDNFGGDAFMWIFALLILAGGGFNGFGGNNVATQDFMQNGFNFNDLQDQNRDLMGAITAGTAQSVAATNQTFHDTLNAVSDKYSELARDISGVAMMQQQAISNQNECCCSIKQQIAENKYEAALNTASINETTVAQTQKILDAMAQSKIEELQAKVSALELQNAVAGVVRYPNQLTYNAGNSPFCNCGM